MSQLKNNAGDGSHSKDDVISKFDQILLGEESPVYKEQLIASIVEEKSQESDFMRERIQKIQIIQDSSIHEQLDSNMINTLEEEKINHDESIEKNTEIKTYTPA